MKISSECVSCVISSCFDLMAKQLPEKLHKTAAAEMLKIASSQDWQESPPEFARKLYTFLRDSGGKADSFAEAKKQSTLLALELMPRMRNIIAQADYEFAAVVKAVIGGNIIDCGINRDMELDSVIPQLKDVFDMFLDEKLIRSFEERFFQAGTLFYMLDNCGEAVFDRLLIERFPGKVILGVRGDFILNDITRHELEDSGLGGYEFVDTGDSTPGVVMSRAKKEFVDAIQSCDMVIAKGQGNFETLDSYHRPIVHLLRLKCPAVARALAMPQHSMALVMRNFQQ